MEKNSSKSKDNKLEERKSRTNAIVGLISIVVLAIVAYFVVKSLGYGMVATVEKLSSLASKLDAVIIVALISGAVSIFGVMLSSIVGKSIDYRKTREAYLAQRREKPYGAFVEMFYKVHKNAKQPGSYTQEEMILDILSFSKELTLWGSKNVVEKWVKYRENGANPEASKDNLFVLEEIMNEMRKDLGVQKVKKGALLSFIINGVVERKK